LHTLTHSCTHSQQALTPANPFDAEVVEKSELTQDTITQAQLDVRDSHTHTHMQLSSAHVSIAYQNLFKPGYKNATKAQIEVHAPLLVRLFFTALNMCMCIFKRAWQKRGKKQGKGGARRKRKVRSRPSPGREEELETG
jgi:hypothetical protein